MNISFLVSMLIEDQCLSYLIDRENIKLNIEIKDDYSEFVDVDGEEGDYGKIYYYTADENIKLATQINNGGDSIEWQFTQEFMNLAEKEILKEINRSVKERFKNSVY